MREEQPLRARGLEGRDRLLGREVAAGLAVELAALERRLAEEEVDVLGQLGKPLARARVARVGERPVAVRDAEAVGLHGVVRETKRRQVETGRPERNALLVLLRVEHAGEHVGCSEARAEGGELLPATGR